MKKRIKRTVLFVLAAIMILSLGGCKGAQSAKEVVFEEGAAFALPQSLSGLVNFNVVGDRIAFYLRNDKLEENDRRIMFWGVGDLNSPETEIQSVAFVPDENLVEGKVLGICLAEDGKMHLLEVGLENGQDPKGYLVIASTDGTVEQKIPVTDTENIDLKSCLFFDDGSFVVYGGKSFTLYGPDGVKDHDFEVPGDFNFSDYYGKVFVLDSTRLFFAENGNTCQNMIYDIKTRSFGNRFATDNTISYVGTGFGEYDFYATDLGSITGYKFDGSLTKEVMSASRSGSTGILKFYPLNEESFIVAQLGDGVSGGVSIFTKQNPENVQTKTEIVLGGTGMMGVETMDAVKAFNKSSDTCKIVIKDYFEENDRDIVEAENKLKLDIISGKVPDILLLGSYSNYQIYANKGVFTDLTPYMENAGIPLSDFLPNIVEAGTVNGKFCLFVPEFGIGGACLTKKEFLDENGIITPTEVMELEKKYNCVGKGIYNCGGMELIYYCCLRSSGEYYNLETGECHFDSDEFVELLKWSKEYPVQIDNSNDSAARYNAVQNNECIAQAFDFHSFHDFNLEDEAAYDNKSALTGFPGNSDPGYISANSIWGISDSSEHKDEAFEFLKYFMSDEYQRDGNNVEMSYTFPSKKTGFDKILQLALEQPKTYNKVTGEYEPQPKTYDKNGKRTEVKNMSEERRDEVANFILSCNKIALYDNSLMEIVADELEKYYADERSAEKTAEAIQSRALIYVKEQGGK